MTCVIFQPENRTHPTFSPLTTHQKMLFFGKKKRLIDYASCAG